MIYLSLGLSSVALKRSAVWCGLAYALTAALTALTPSAAAQDARAGYPNKPVRMVVAFAPIAAFLLGVTNVSVPWETLVLATVLYVVLPLLAGMATRKVLANTGPAAVNALVARLKPWSMVGLIATVILLFGFQAETIIAQPAVIGLIAVPLILQTYGIFFLSWWAAKWLKLPHEVAGPACLIGTSNFFELAVAVAISLFGLKSGAALATVVGVLVEVPVMLSLVAMLNAWKPRAS